MNHSEFLKKYLNKFWIKVFSKTLAESYYGGIIGAHGDKGDCYRSNWEKAGIPFNHGMMMYMLTYTNLMDRPKHESEHWVIDNYPKYKTIINSIEEKS